MSIQVSSAGIAIVIAVAAMLTTASCAPTDLDAYRSRNPEEEGIIALLKRYETAKMHFDLAAYLDCLHDQGRYHYADSLMVSKQTLADLLPGFWAGLQNNDLLIYPMARECLNGNFIPKGHLTNPKIRISGNTARVTATFAHGLWRLRQYFSLILIDERWWINRLEWETG